MNNKIIFIAWKDLYYQPDRDGWVSLFERYIEFLIKEKKKTIHYLTSIGYSWWENVEEKRKFQTKNINLNQINDLYIHRINIDPKINMEQYKNARDKFERRLVISEAESKSWELADLNLSEISRIHIFHVSHAISLVLNNILPIEKIVLHPMMTWIWYSKYTNVPKKYIEQEIKVFEKIKIIQTPSFNERGYLINYYGVDSEKIIVNSRGYDETCFLSKERKLPQKWETINIICANMIRSQKWQKYFIQFASHCKENNILMKIQLIWVNENSYDESYKKYYLELLKEIKQKGLEEYFIFYDVMPPDKLNKIMLSSHFSIITSEYETFWKSALESSATGLPTILFDDVEAFWEFIVNGVNWIKTKRDSESKKLFNSFLKLINNSDIYENISKNWIKMWVSYNWSKLFNNMENDINSKIIKIWK